MKYVLYPLAVAAGCFTLAAVATVGGILWAHHRLDDAGPFGEIPQPPAPTDEFVAHIDLLLEQISASWDYELDNWKADR